MMKRLIFLLLLLSGNLSANTMEKFAYFHVPMRPDGKIDIPIEIRHIKLDIGLSYSAPMSQQWLSKENDLMVFGFEPDPTSVETIKRGAVKQHPVHGDPLEARYVGDRMFIFPCALGLQSGGVAKFFVTKESCGCSSLYYPVFFEVEKVLEVPVFRLSDFFDLMPFDTHPVIDYIKIDAQGSDLDILKSAGQYLEERVVYVTAEPENDQYKETSNSEGEMDRYMRSIGFRRDHSQDTGDPTYLNLRFLDYVQKNKIKIYQRG